jgi:hypothetical protein
MKCVVSTLRGARVASVLLGAAANLIVIGEPAPPDFEQDLLRRWIAAGAEMGAWQRFEHRYPSVDDETFVRRVYP